MNTIQDGDKFYRFDESNRVATASNSISALMTETESPEVAPPFLIGDRVEIGGRVGSVTAISSTLYGDTARVQLDDADVLSGVFLGSLSHTTVEKPNLSAVQELVTEFENYESFLAAGLHEVRQKAAKARELNLRAKSLIGKAKLEEKISLDKVIVTTSVDAEHLRNDEQALQAAEEHYLETLPRAEYAVEGHSGHSHPSEDASWIVAAAEEFEEELSAVNWDGFLAAEAVDLADRINEGFISDPEAVNEIAETHFSSVAQGLGAEIYKQRLAQFKGFVKAASSERTEKIAKVAQQKTASAVNYDDVPFEALFL